MTKRPYFKKSIDELEALFATSNNNPNTLSLLEHELQHRHTKRANSLLFKIEAVKLTEITNTTRAPQTIDQSQEKNEDLDTKNYSTIAKEIAPELDINPQIPITNDPQNILRTWTALEVLSPQSYRRETDLVAGNHSRIARFEKSDLPWQKSEKSLPKKRLYYELILGSVALGPAVESLLKVYADKRPDQPSMQGYCPIASILLDKEGCPLTEDNSFAISSFAWGVPIALQGDLQALAEWPDHEKNLKSAFQKLLFQRDDQENVLPLTKEHISQLFNFLVNKMNLDVLELKQPYFALRRYEHFYSKTSPEPSLLNSFFLDDLSIARNHIKNGTLPHALRHYLGIEKPTHKINLLQDTLKLQQLLQPSQTPLGKWPGNGRFPLALLQQAAVNAATPALMETGILGVNGPPGTGKTTLLRDVVAARIIERAEVMSTYTNPADAFSPTSQTLQRNGAKITLHKLDEKLKGFEMVVTSSNNKAVENVSAELPVIGAIASDAPELRYFKTISDNLLECDTWGTISAVLGNASNRYIFSQKFWRDDENGLSTYLNHACGIPQIALEFQDDGTSIKRYRDIVNHECPPANPKEAGARWKEACTHFKQALKVSQDSQKILQKLHTQLQRLLAIAVEIKDIESTQSELLDKIASFKLALSEAQQQLKMAEADKTQKQNLKETYLSARPGLFARLLRTRRFQEWSAEIKVLEDEVRVSDKIYNTYRKQVDTLHNELTKQQSLSNESVKEIEKLAEEKNRLDTQTKKIREDFEVPVLDDAFFTNTHEDIQKASVWFNQAANKIRDDLFEAAIHLHRAFIDAAADPLRQNLSIFIESFGTHSLGTAKKDALIADLWASFFLVVPIVSTTFASVNRMFSRLAPESLGWLLVDEAGQAVPQAAVGAMLRTKRAVIVGDPLQIEPVVTLPNSLTEKICTFFGVDPIKYNPPEASVQTLADMASMYYARFPIGSGYRDVGAPLLVHRRCNSPMFEISNEIAYSNLMVQAKKPSPVNAILGPSAWINVQGNPGPDKWCADEADVLIDKLYQLRRGGMDADLYIVTPFVIVQDNLRQEILKSHVLNDWVDKPDAWVREHVGTVHTVQGREAKIVFFVLGAQMTSQNGARAWAGGKPNLVNVAITRAKESLYVIGNRHLWKSAGVFAVLDRYLPNH